MKEPGGKAGQIRGGTATIVAQMRPNCPYSTDCQIVELRDPNGRVQAITCRLCTMLATRTELHFDLTGTPGCG